MLGSGGTSCTDGVGLQLKENVVPSKVYKVKIQHDLSSSMLLNIVEVEVYDKSGINQALGKAAEQS
eukprot:scaffold335253_cov149-Cyclotella_meneghiniana.AAC.1